MVHRRSRLHLAGRHAVVGILAMGLFGSIPAWGSPTRFATLTPESLESTSPFAIRDSTSALACVSTLAQRLATTNGAAQLVTVVTSTSNSSYAQLTLFELTGGCWLT